MCRHRLSTLLAVSIVLFGGGPSLGRQICKPQLSFKEVRSSEPRNLEWKWTAVLAVDASACATTFGRFEINFLREKEDAPELEFSERFTWQTGELRIGQIEVRSTSGSMKLFTSTRSATSRRAAAVTSKAGSYRVSGELENDMEAFARAAAARAAGQPP
jgi:hypothetical protein